MRYRILLLSILFAANLYPQKRLALVIGIGHYPQESGWQTIHGDIDADSISVMLWNAGYDNVNILKNSAATKSAIVQAFRLLARQASVGDIVYVHFSGHGQQMIDLNGDEPDNRDESWIPYDAYKQPNPNDRGEKHLVDDQIGLLLDSVYAKVGESGRIVVVADACHSGTSTRGWFFRRGTRQTFPYQNSLAVKSSANHPWLLISACRDDQLNSELRKPAMGLLSFAICTAVRNSKSTDNLSFLSELQRIVNSNKPHDLDQTIVVTGDLTRFNLLKILSDL